MLLWLGGVNLRLSVLALPPGLPMIPRDLAYEVEPCMTQQLDHVEIKLLAIVSGGVHVTISPVDEHECQCVLRVVSTTVEYILLTRLGTTRDSRLVGTREALTPGVDPLQSLPDGLTGREREVASLLAQGLSNRRIAEQLVIAEKTAKNHVQRVLERVGVRSRAEVAARADELGLQRRQVAHALF